MNYTLVIYLNERNLPPKFFLDQANGFQRGNLGLLTLRANP
jgi:hypothetical protein